MPLFFSNPAVLWLFPAIVLPIVFHLFFRLRRQVKEFPSLMFFLRIDPRLSAKRKIHEWLILFLRCLFLALLILALARPSLGLKGAGGSVARLVLIDNSGSMAGPTVGGGSKLDLAARSTEVLLAAARPGESTAVRLMLPDPISTLPEKFGAPAASIRDALAKLSPSDGAAPVAGAIRSALTTLATTKAPQHELDIITDLQKKNWSRGDLGAEATNCRIVVHRIEAAPLHLGSVSLEVGPLPTRKIPAGRITPIGFILRNHGPVEAHVHVSRCDDSGKSDLREMNIPAHASKPMTLTFSFPNPGFHWAQIWLEGDAAPTASRTEIGFSCTDACKAIFAGNKDDFGAMPYAVAPGGNANLSGIDAVFIGVDQLRAVLAAKPIAVVLTWDGMASGGDSAVQDYVRAGGTLFVLPSAETGVAIPRPAPGWLGAGTGALVKEASAGPAVLLREGDSFWRDLRDTGGQPQLGGLRIFQYLPLQTDANWQTLIASAKGAPLLARRSWERGQIYASGLGFTPKWSSLPLKASFVVLMQNVVFGAGAEKMPVRAIRAGESYRFDLPREQAGVSSLAGAALDWHGLGQDFAGFIRSGIYEIEQHGDVSWVAVSGNADEADPQQLSLARVPLLHNLTHDVLSLSRPEDIMRTSVLGGSGFALYRWLLLAALIVLFFETWLANERSSDLCRKLFATLLTAAPPGGRTKPKELAPL